MFSFYLKNYLVENCLVLNTIYIRIMRSLFCLLGICLIGCSKGDTAPALTTPPVLQYTLSVTAGAGGSVSTTGGTYDAGSQVSITATPNGDYVFSGWSNGSSENPIALTVNSNTTLSANFEKRRYPLTIFTQGQGTVTETLVTAGKTPTEYTTGSVVRLTAVAADNWEFSAWSGAISSTTNPVEITVDEAKTITATFDQPVIQGELYDENSSPNYIDVIGQGSFRLIVLENKDGILDVQITAINGENSYWEKYTLPSDPQYLVMRYPPYQTPVYVIQDVDPTIDGFIQIHFRTEPVFRVIENTNINVHYTVQNLDDDYFRELWNAAVTIAGQTNISQLYTRDDYFLRTSVYRQVDANTYSGGNSFCSEETGIVTYPNCNLSTLFHEYGHAFQYNILSSELNNNVVVPAHQRAQNDWNTRFGFTPTFTVNCDSNFDNCAPYQTWTDNEFFAVLTTAYFGIPDGGDPSVGDHRTRPQLSSASDIQTHYPEMYDLFLNIYGAPPAPSVAASFSHLFSAPVETDSTTQTAVVTSTGDDDEVNQDDSSTTTTSSSTTSTETSGTSSATTSYTTTLTPFTNPDSGYGNFTKKVVVFDIPLYGTDQVEDAKLSHAANVMAQYLDNDEDGTPDNPSVVEALKSNNGFMLVWKNESDLAIFDSLANADAGQDLGADETIPAWHTNGQTGQFDATLEEVLHLITHIGYHNAYPSVFGETIGSDIANAMDIARGGQFTSIPSTYPSGAWYTYDDETCDYACQVTEYVFWALTSILGAHDNRLSEIDQEWLLNTNAKVQQSDTAVYSLLTDPQYGFPTVLPDGQYQQ